MSATCHLCLGPASRSKRTSHFIGQKGAKTRVEFIPVCRKCKQTEQLSLFSASDRDANRQPYLYSIVGPAYSGKTEEFVREVRHHVAAGLQVQVFYSLESRNEGPIEAYNGRSAATANVGSLQEVIQRVHNDTQVICVDSIEAFPDVNEKRAIEEISGWVEKGKTVVTTGRDVDPYGGWIEAVGNLLCYSDRVKKLSATCSRCGKLHRAPRVIDIGDQEASPRFTVSGPGRNFRPICRACWREWKKPMPGNENRGT